MFFKSLLFEKESIRSKELTDRYTEIKKNKEADQINFKENLFALIKDISLYMREEDGKERFVKNFCNTLNNILGDIIGFKEWLDDENNFSEFINFMKTLLSVKNKINHQINNLTVIIEFLDANQNKEIDPIIFSFYNNENWIPYIEKKNYFPLILQKLKDESLINRNNQILKALSNNIKNYNAKAIPSFIEGLSKLSDKIPKEIRFSFSELLYNIFILSDDYYRIFQQKSGTDILLRLFKKGDSQNIDADKAGYEIADFFCLFLYKEFNKLLYEMIIEDEPALENQDVIDDDQENLTEEELIEKYSFKLSCLKSLSSTTDQLKPEMFELTHDQIIDIRKVQLMNSTDKSFLSKIERNPKLASLKRIFTVSYSQLLSQLRSEMWKKDSQKIDRVILEDYWNKEDGINYLVNIRNPSILEYKDEYFNKFESWDVIYDRMERSDALISLYLTLFTLTKADKLQTDDNIRYINRLYDIYETRNELFNKIAKTIIRFSFKHFLFLLRNSPNDEIFNAITVLSFNNCYVKYDMSLYTIFLKFSLQFNEKLFETDNFKQLLNIYKINVEEKTPDSTDLANVALLLLDKHVMTSNSREIVSLASDTISSASFDNKSCIDRLAFRILQEVDLDLDDAFKVLNGFQPSYASLPLYLSVNPNSAFLNEQFLSNGIDQFDFYASLNILPRTFVKKLLLESDLVKKKSHPSILTAVLRLWPYLHDNHEEDDEFKNYYKIIPYLIKNNSSIKESLDISLLILCLMYFDRTLISSDDFNTLLEIFVTELKNDPYKEFWFTVLLSSHQISTSFTPLPFLKMDEPINTPLNLDEFRVEMAPFDSYEITKKTIMTVSCLAPFTNFSYTINEESSSSENDSTQNEIKKATIHPNKEVIEDEKISLDFQNWKTFIDSLLSISNQIESKQKMEERQRHENNQMCRVSLIQALIDILFNNNTFKFKVDNNFLKTIFLGNPYSTLSEIEDNLQIFVEFFSRQNVFNSKVFEFILNCAIDGWFCERIGAVLNSLFMYYSRFYKRVSKNLLLAYKLGFYRISLKEVQIFLCLMEEYETLFFTLFNKSDYFFYHNRISEFIEKAEIYLKNKNDSLDFDAIIEKCKRTINLLNSKYSEIILRKKPKKKKGKKDEDNINDDKSKNKKDDSNDETEVNNESKMDETNENDDESQVEKANDLKEVNNESKMDETNENDDESQVEKANDLKEVSNESKMDETNENDDESQVEKANDPKEEEEANENNDNEDYGEYFEEEEEDIDYNDYMASEHSYSTEIFPDADEKEFKKFNEELYEKNLSNTRIKSEKAIKKFRLESKKRFDSKIASIMDFVYREMRSSEMIVENYRKIWFDLNNFDQNFIIRKAEYEFEDILKNKIDLKTKYQTSKEHLFKIFEFITGLKSNNNNVVSFKVKMNNILGMCFFCDDRIIFIEGMISEGEFGDVQDYNKEDENYCKVISISHHFEGRILLEIQRKQICKLTVSKRIAQFEFSGAKIFIENASEEEFNLAKLLS